MKGKLFLIAFAVFFVDRIFKIASLSGYENSFFKYSLNTGAAFGILKGWNVFLILFGLIVIFFILYYRKEKGLEIGFGFLLGGTVANTFDRVMYNGVVDYIHVDVLNNIFNLADVANVIGGLILAYIFWNEK